MCTIQVERKTDGRAQARARARTHTHTSPVESMAGWTTMDMMPRPGVIGIRAFEGNT